MTDRVDQLIEQSRQLSMGQQAGREMAVPRRQARTEFETTIFYLKRDWIFCVIVFVLVFLLTIVVIERVVG